MSRRKTNEEFLKEVFNLVGNEYTVLDEYINNKTKITFKHNKCNNIWKITPHNFINNNIRCPKCSGKYKRTNKDFINEIYELVGDEYTPLSEYKTDGTKKPDKIKFKHNICNRIFEMRAHDFINLNHRCPYCSNKIISDKKKLSNEEFLEKVYNLVGNEYTVLDKYDCCKKEIRFKHNICNRIFTMKPKKFIYDNHRCPYCKESKGEIKIRKWLEDHNINFESQYSFPDCKYKLPLRFDFKILKDNKIILIEYDGVQHFQESFYDNLEKQQIRDKIKNDYCKKNNLKLIRISYEDYSNIEKILNDLLIGGTKSEKE